ncbi:hypothetical protein GCM10020001_092520 [Nonomuraea salmonea]
MTGLNPGSGERRREGLPPLATGEVMSLMTREMERHPDIISMREKYDVAAAKPAVQLADGLTLVAGLFLALSPWIIGFTGITSLTMNNLITGLAVAVLALGFSSAYGRTHGIAWVAPLIGLWTILAPWLIRGGGGHADHDHH